MRLAGAQRRKPHLVRVLDEVPQLLRKGGLVVGGPHTVHHHMLQVHQRVRRGAVPGEGGRIKEGGQEGDVLDEQEGDNVP